MEYDDIFKRIIEMMAAKCRCFFAHYMGEYPSILKRCANNAEFAYCNSKNHIEMRDYK